MIDHQYPQDLLDIVENTAHDFSGDDGGIIAGNVIDAIDRYRAQHTPAPDVSDEALAQLFTNTMARHVIDHRGKGYIEGTGLLAGIAAVRARLASGGEAVDVPGWVTWVRVTLEDGPPWEQQGFPTRSANGAGLSLDSAIAAAIATTASKESE